MSSSIEELKKTVLQAVEQAPLSKKIEEVAVETDVDDDGTEFLRVNLSMRGSKDEPDEAFEALLEKIENAILAVDERYPSVRFLDAA